MNRAVTHRCALSVNLNKVATVRNTRHLGIPSLTRAATLCLKAGAAGITVHPRPDERHIRAADVHDLASLLHQWPGREYNIEGNPAHNLLGFVDAVKPQQATFVPDAEGQFTSDHGWQFPADFERLVPWVRRAQAAGARVSLFMDPVPEQMEWARRTGADRVELYTEPYAAAHAAGRAADQLARYRDAAVAAQEAGLEVNAGHDLNLHNLGDFLRAVPHVAEVSIGHALLADALEMGYGAAVQAYLATIDASC